MMTRSFAQLAAILCLAAAFLLCPSVGASAQIDFLNDQRPGYWLAEKDDLGVWWRESGWKIGRERGLPEKPPDGHKASTNSTQWSNRESSLSFFGASLLLMSESVEALVGGSPAERSQTTMKL